MEQVTRIECRVPEFDEAIGYVEWRGEIEFTRRTDAPHLYEMRIYTFHDRAGDEPTVRQSKFCVFLQVSELMKVALDAAAQAPQNALVKGPHSEI